MSENASPPADSKRRRRVHIPSLPLIVAGSLLVLAAFLFTGAAATVLTLGGLALLVTAALIPRRPSTRSVPSSPHLSAAAAHGLSLAALDAVVAALPDPTIALDGDNRVISFNADARRLAPTLRRYELASVVLRAPEIVDAVRAVAAGGEAVVFEFTPRGSADRHFNVHVTPVAKDRAAPGETGAAAPFILIVFHDLTPLIRVEEMRADFVANASHELRTPLASLAGFIDTLQGPARNDEAARDRFLKIMRAQATRMARLIEDLLSLSRIELNAHQRPTDPVALDGVIRQVVDSLQTLSTERDVTVVIENDCETATVLGDRDELIRVFENLIENALKYGGSGKRVEITVTRALDAAGAPEFTVSVRDYGPGIAPEYLPRLTERFYRIDVRDSRAQGGTGLGLALVKHILNRHRGRLTIASTPNQGATFTVHLPQPSPQSLGV